MARPLNKPRSTQAQHLADLRKAAGLTQTALAKLINEPQQSIAAWEVMDRPLRSNLLPKLAKALGVSVEEILNIPPPPHAPRRRGPVGKVAKLFAEVSKLPARQQDQIAQVVSALVNQFKQQAA